MRSASCGVVIEPSTSERSYGPLTTAREASTKLAISTAPASVNSSSSQSSRLSWQPSQDANFHTASLGRRFATSDLPQRHEPFDAIVGEHRAILADERRAELAVAAESDGTLHVAF